METMQYVRIVFADMNGAMKGKLIPSDQFSIEKSYGMPRSVLAQDIEGEELHALEKFSPESGDRDMQLKADESTLSPAPGNDNLHQVIADLKDEHGELFPEAPRTVLWRALERLSAAGFDAKTASELEFFVLKANGEVYDSRELEQPYGDINALEKLGGLLGQLVDGTAAIGLKPEAVLSEAGPGQMEINFSPTNPLEMADRTLFFKQMVREVARANKLQATFLAKPFAAHSGSGCHVHISLWKDGHNVFAADKELLESFAAGAIANAHDAYALCAPNPNSYRRVLLSHGYVPASPSFGEDDRRVAFRFVGEGEGRRLECRIAGSDANPYLLLAYLIHAGLNGIEDKLTLKHDAVLAASGRYFMDNLPQALDELTVSDFANKYFGEEFVTTFAAVKQQEWQKFQNQITSWERDTFGIAA